MRKIYVYGVGNNFFEYEPIIRKRYEIIGFFDSNRIKQGNFLYGLEIQSPNKVLNYQYDYILVTPNCYLEIKDYLIELGVDENKILILHKELDNPRIDNNVLHIYFSIGGGMGDILVAFNYVYCWSKKYKNSNCEIKILCDNVGELLLKFGSTYEYIDEIIIQNNQIELIDESDLFISIRRYPKVIKSLDYKIARLAPEIIDYIFLCSKFMIFHPDLVGIELLSDGKSVDYEKSIGHKRINQPDIYNNLEIGEEYTISSLIEPNILLKYDLQKCVYVTIHRGCDKRFFNCSNVKIWNEDNYEKVIKLLQRTYKDIKVILLGEDYERSDKLVSCDLNLLGKTNFEDLKCLLKNALVHIDTEGGLVHLRHAVKGGPSVVLFGPTDPDFYGYSENINIRTDTCPTPCEWKTLDWINACSNEDQKCCMSSITPEMVYKKVVTVLEKTYKFL